MKEVEPEDLVIYSNSSYRVLARVKSTDGSTLVDDIIYIECDVWFTSLIDSYSISADEFIESNYGNITYDEFIQNHPDILI